MSALPPMRVPAGSLCELGATEVRAVRLLPTSNGMRREVLVLRDANGEVRAYRNLCKHLPILLDAGSRKYLSADGKDLLCNTHGARYRRDDGLCVHGPCKGASLDAVPIVVEGDALLLLDDGR